MGNYRLRTKPLHFAVNNITRTKGHNAVAALAYRSGGKLYCAKEQKYHDYSKKRGIVKTQLCVPDHAPDWMLGYSEHYNWQRFANEIEKKEDSHNRRGSALLAKDFVAAAPRELTIEQNWQVAKAFARKLGERGLAVAVAFHQTKASDGGMNPHFHFMVAMRHLDKNGFGNRYRDFDLPNKNAQAIKTLRHEYFACVNNALQDANIRNLYYDPDKQPDQIPTQHLGKNATFLERTNGNTRIAHKNRITRLENYMRRVAMVLNHSQAGEPISVIKSSTVSPSAKAALSTKSALNQSASTITPDYCHKATQIAEQARDSQSSFWQQKIANPRTLSTQNPLSPPINRSYEHNSFTERIKNISNQQPDKPPNR